MVTGTGITTGLTAAMGGITTTSAGYYGQPGYGGYAGQPGYGGGYYNQPGYGGDTISPAMCDYPPPGDGGGGSYGQPYSRGNSHTLPYLPYYGDEGG